MVYLYVTTPTVNVDIPVNAFNLNGFITAPIIGEIPDTNAIDTNQYGGTIEWFAIEDEAAAGVIAFGKTYKAIFSLTVKEGFTFSGG